MKDPIRVRYGLAGEEARTLVLVDRPSLHAVRALRVDGCLVAEVRETDRLERTVVVDRTFAATWVGWHRGQTPGYGNTDVEAVLALIAGTVVYVPSLEQYRVPNGKID